MDYEQASRIGSIGERRVGDVLRAESAALGFRLIEDVLLLDDTTTTQIDHLAIDRFGILVVETKCYNALIKGRSGDSYWTACYRGQGRRRERFQNPLRQNDRHRKNLQRVLLAYGVRLPDTYLQSLVVFVGGDVGHMNLDDADSLRVIPDSGIVENLRARCGDFTPNPGTLDAEQIATLVSTIQSANHADDAAAVELHASNVDRASRRFLDRFRIRRPAPSSASPSSPYGAAMIYHRGARYPDTATGSTPERPRPMTGAARSAAAALLVLGVGWWLLFGGGLAAMLSFSAAIATRAGAGFQPQSPTEQIVGTPTTTVSYDVNSALQRLNEASPEVYSRLSNPTDPQLSITDGMATYTWEYVSKSAANTANVSRISITLDSAGRIVGVGDGS